MAEIENREFPKPLNVSDAATDAYAIHRTVQQEACTQQRSDQENAVYAAIVLYESVSLPRGMMVSN